MILRARIVPVCEAGEVAGGRAVDAAPWREDRIRGFVR
jgi:hypothetical protein